MDARLRFHFRSARLAKVGAPTRDIADGARAGSSSRGDHHVDLTSAAFAVLGELEDLNPALWQPPTLLAARAEFALRTRVQVTTPHLQGAARGVVANGAQPATRSTAADATVRCCHRRGGCCCCCCFSRCRCCGHCSHRNSRQRSSQRWRWKRQRRHLSPSTTATAAATTAATSLLGFRRHWGDLRAAAAAGRQDGVGGMLAVESFFTVTFFVVTVIDGDGHSTAGLLQLPLIGKSVLTPSLGRFSKR